MFTIATELGVAYVSITASLRNFRAPIAKELSAVERSGEASGKALGTKMGGSFASSLKAAVGPALAVFGAGAIAGFAKQAVGAFSELEDSTAAAGVVFGDNMKQIIDQSKTASKNMGLTEQQVINAANTFGTYGKAAGLSGKDLADFATEQTQLAADMASFKGTSPEQAIEAIGAALRGEAEPIRAYGVMLDDASLKNEAMAQGLITTTKEALTPQQKTLAAQALILKQTTDAQGDFARTSDSTANIQKTLSAEASNLSAKLGEKLAPALTAGREAALKVVAGMSRLLDQLSVQIPAAISTATAWFERNKQTLTIVAGVITAILLPAFARMAVGAVVSAAKSVAAWVMTQVAAIRTGVVYVAQSALIIGRWVWMGAQALIQAARMAAAWVIAMGPIGWVIAAVVGLAALVIANWDKISAWTAKAWAAITKWIGEAWANITKAVSDGINWVVNWITTRIAILQLAWRLMWDAISQKVSDIWNAIKSGVAAAIDWVVNWVTTRIQNLQNNWNTVWTTVKNTISTIWDGIKTAISNAWGVLKGIFQKLIDFVTINIPNGFQKAGDGIKTAWDKIQEIAKKPVRFVIERVINDGLIGTFNKIPGVNIPKVKLPRGFADGGYTGDGGKYEPAGVVHKGEYVVTKEETKRLGGAAAVRNMIDSGAGGVPGAFMGNRNAIARHGAYYLKTAAGLGPWNFPGAARMWDGAAGVRVRMGSGQHQGYVSAAERGGGILGYTTGTNIDMSPSWMARLGATQRRTVAAHEIGHALGLPHMGGNSIMAAALGNMASVPTSQDIRMLQRLYPGGTGKAGSGAPENPFAGMVGSLMEAFKKAFPGAGMFVDAAGGLAKSGIESVVKFVSDIAGNIGKIVGDITGGVVDGIRNFFGGGAAMLHDQGGVLQPGLSTILNKTGKPEAILNQQQWSDISKLALSDTRPAREIVIQGNVGWDPAEVARRIETAERRQRITEGVLV